jgi:RNA polymerase sigma-70 factor (ECF subfamily)
MRLSFLSAGGVASGLRAILSSVGLSIIWPTSSAAFPDHLLSLDGSQDKTARSPGAGAKKPTAEIVRDFKHGRDREHNFELLYKRYFESVLRFVASLSKGTLCREDAKDLTDEIFLSVWKGLSRLRDENKFEAWLLAVAKKMCFSEIKRQRSLKRVHDYNHDSLDSIQDSQASTTISPDQAWEHKEQVERVRQAVQAMSPQRRRAMKLWLDGHSIREIASFLAIKPGTVKALLHQAREYLKETLGLDLAEPQRSVSESDG